MEGPSEIYRLKLRRLSGRDQEFDSLSSDSLFVFFPFLISSSFQFGMFIVGFVAEETSTNLWGQNIMGTMISEEKGNNSRLHHFFFFFFLVRKNANLHK